MSPLEHLLVALADDREDLERQLAKLSAHEVDETSSEERLAFIAHLLSNTYQILEDALVRVAATFDQRPEGVDWHKTLLTSATSATNLRPAVLSRPIADALDDLRQFRHFLRHGSARVTLVGDKLADVRRATLDVAEALLSDPRGFEAHVQVLAREGDDA
jgi:hypothetical protein